MTDRDPHSARCCVRRELGGAGKLRRQRHQPHLAFGSVIESVKDCDVWREQVGRGLFDPKYMTALYDYGYAKGRADDRFRNPLSMARPEQPTASGGPPPESAPKKGDRFSIQPPLFST